MGEERKIIDYIEKRSNTRREEGKLVKEGEMEEWRWRGL